MNKGKETKNKDISANVVVVVLFGYCAYNGCVS